MNENIATMVGRVASDVTTHRFDGGTVKATFRMACTERRRDWKTGDWVDGDRLFLTVICWRTTAENVSASLQKGDPVVARGRMRTREWESEGQRGVVLEMDAVAIGPDLTWCSTVLTRNPRAAVRPVAAGEPELVGAGVSAPAAVEAAARA